MPSRLYYTSEQSPVGPLLIVGDANALRQVWFVPGRRKKTPDDSWQLDSGMFREVVRQLRAYFAGELREFDLKLELSGTDFQRRCWQALQTIPLWTNLFVFPVSEKNWKSGCRTGRGIGKWR